MNGLFIILILSVLLCVYRIFRGPTSADRMAGIDILGIIVVIFCVLLALLTGKDFYMTIAIAWAVLGFISTITLAKFLEGRNLDE
jgi:multicomponent Na+:H+ antiporter subunit F